MSGSIYSVCIGPQSSCQNHSEEGVVCVCARALGCVSVCLCACVRASARERRGAWRGAELLAASRSTASRQRRCTWHLRLPEGPLLPARWERCCPRRRRVLQPAAARSPNMGCSFCSLQKPEEQYKLLYEVCQVTLPPSPWEWPGSRRAEPNSWERSWGSLHVCVCVWNENSLSDVSVCLLWSLLGDFLDSGPRCLYLSI